MIHLALADDDKLFTDLLAGYLNAHDQINVDFVVHGGQELIQQLGTASPLPEIVLLDLRMKNGDGLSTLETIKQESIPVKVMVLSSLYNQSFMGFMIKSGASAFLPKDLLPEKLIEIILEVHERGHYFLPEQVDVMRNQLSSRAPKPEVSDGMVLSEREEEVLRLICQQHTAKEIGEKLFVTTRTVEGHKNRIMQKTGARNTAGLVIYAVQHQLIDPNSLIIL